MVKVVKNSENVCWALTKKNKLFKMKVNEDNNMVTSEEVLEGVWSTHQFLDIYCGNGFEIVLVCEENKKKVNIMGRGE